VYNLFAFRFIVISLLVLGATPSCAKQDANALWLGPSASSSPADASYLFDNNWIRLENGRAGWQAAPGSATKIRIALFGETVLNDLNNDGNDDAVIFLTYQGGGSGTFFYLAAALQENGKYRGTNTIWLGDRIGPPAARVQNGLVIVEYLDRNQNEPMTVAPSLLQKRYFILVDSLLQEIKLAVDDAVYQGWLTIGHEVYSFQPCEKSALWLLGKPVALDASIAAYRKTMSGFPPYTPVFAILSGTTTIPPEEGFGAEYEQAFSVSQIVHIWPKGNCRSNWIRLDSPLPGANISSPVTIKGKARGIWFFEGDFPVILLDSQDNKIAESYATAHGEWMSEDFVEFEGVIPYSGALSGQRGFLLLKKDNPTGMEQFDDALRIPITFE